MPPDRGRRGCGPRRKCCCFLPALGAALCAAALWAPRPRAADGGLELPAELAAAAAAGWGALEATREIAPQLASAAAAAAAGALVAAESASAAGLRTASQSLQQLYLAGVPAAAAGLWGGAELRRKDADGDCLHSGVPIVCGGVATESEEACRAAGCCWEEGTCVTSEERLALRHNFANDAYGARVVALSGGVRGARNSVLVADKDKYISFPTQFQRKFITIQLPAEISPDVVAIANYEYHSSSPHEVWVLGSQKFPCTVERDCRWSVLGRFHAAPRRGLQVFALQRRQFLRYVRLLFVTHHGDDAHFTLSAVRVFGTDILTDFNTAHEQAPQGQEEEEEDRDGEDKHGDGQDQAEGGQGAQTAPPEAAAEENGGGESETYAESPDTCSVDESETEDGQGNESASPAPAAADATDEGESPGESEAHTKPGTGSWDVSPRMAQTLGAAVCSGAARPSWPRNASESAAPVPAPAAAPAARGEPAVHSGPAGGAASPGGVSPTAEDSGRVAAQGAEELLAAVHQGLTGTTAPPPAHATGLHNPPQRHPGWMPAGPPTSANTTLNFSAVRPGTGAPAVAPVAPLTATWTEPRAPAASPGATAPAEPAAGSAAPAQGQQPPDAAAAGATGAAEVQPAPGKGTPAVPTADAAQTGQPGAGAAKQRGAAAPASDSPAPQPPASEPAATPPPTPLPQQPQRQCPNLLNPWATPLGFVPDSSVCPNPERLPPFLAFSLPSGPAVPGGPPAVALHWAVHFGSPPPPNSSVARPPKPSGVNGTAANSTANITRASAAGQNASRGGQNTLLQQHQMLKEQQKELRDRLRRMERDQRQVLANITEAHELIMQQLRRELAVNNSAESSKCDEHVKRIEDKQEKNRGQIQSQWIAIGLITFAVIVQLLWWRADRTRAEQSSPPLGDVRIPGSLTVAHHDGSDGECATAEAHSPYGGRPMDRASELPSPGHRGALRTALHSPSAWMRDNSLSSLRSANPSIASLSVSGPRGRLAQQRFALSHAAAGTQQPPLSPRAQQQQRAGLEHRDLQYTPLPSASVTSSCMQSAIGTAHGSPEAGAGRSIDWLPRDGGPEAGRAPAEPVPQQQQPGTGRRRKSRRQSAVPAPAEAAAAAPAPPPPPDDPHTGASRPRRRGKRHQSNAST